MTNCVILVNGAYIYTYTSKPDVSLLEILVIGSVDLQIDLSDIYLELFLVILFQGPDSNVIKLNLLWKIILPENIFRYIS